VVGGRILVSLTAIMLVVMPLTEHYWTFDDFFRSGQDLELSLLLTVTALCLVLVLSLQRNNRADSVSPIAVATICLRGTGSLTRKSAGRILATSPVIAFPDSPLAAYSLPIQI
jgi:hypothetical protein